MPDCIDSFNIHYPRSAWIRWGDTDWFIGLTILHGNKIC